MNNLERLYDWIQHETTALAGALPGEPEEAVHALLEARRSLDAAESPSRKTVTGVATSHSGLGIALQLLLEGGVDDPGIDADEEWATGFLAACDALAEARIVATHVESGFMKLDDSVDASIDAWIATKLAPARWRELAAWTRWAAWNNGLAEVERPADSTLLFSYQFGYPAESTLFGAKAGEWSQIAGKLFDLAESADAEPLSVTFDGLVGYLAERLKAKPETIAERVPLFMLTRENAEWHASPPAIAAAPLIEVGDGKLVVSPHGVWMAPLMFVTREMRRRNAESYHNASQAREDLFRRELYALFPESRYVTARNRVLLRKPEGEARTDIDAAIFDKKTGTLALFELKALDPFARSTAELNRQRDNTLEAGHQIGAILDWINKHSPDELLKRIDPGTAKKFKVQRVLPFALGRCVIRFDDGPAPDARAGWSEWPGFIRQVETVATSNASNPLLSLHSGLLQAKPVEIDPNAFTPHEIRLDETQRTIRVFPSRSSLNDAHAGD